ncbi:MAG TPA: hypothetical protein VJS92_02370 [Candidatus Polarisedimenticolaceae bacterium]|nr:hypothetical protein [Candidatus Polarisedimenticolaceae bacterium]
MSGALDRWMFEEYRTPAASLAVCRILYAACILGIYLPQHLWIARFPDSFLNPPYGFTIFFAGFPPAAYFVALNVLAVFAGVGLLVGYRTRACAVGLALLLLAGNAWAYSFGKINNDILLVVIPLVLQFSGWGDAYSLDARRGRPVDPSRNAWPLALLALVVGCAMLTGAQPKAASGWLDPHTHAVRGHLLRNAYVVGRMNPLAALMLRVQSGAFWEAFDDATVLLEGALVFAVVRRGAFRTVCALACLFHLGIALTMEIAYWPNPLAYAAFCDWSVLGSRPWARRAAALWETGLVRLGAGGAALVAAAIAVVYLTLGNPLEQLILRLGGRPELVLGLGVCAPAAAVAVVFLVRPSRAAPRA